MLHFHNRKLRETQKMIHLDISLKKSKLFEKDQLISKLNIEISSIKKELSSLKVENTNLKESLDKSREECNEAIENFIKLKFQQIKVPSITPETEEILKVVNYEFDNFPIAIKNALEHKPNPSNIKVKLSRALLEDINLIHLRSVFKPNQLFTLIRLPFGDREEIDHPCFNTFIEELR